MSGKAAKGKGKSRGGGAGATSQRHSRSRNTTPASGSALSADAHLSDAPPAKVTYEDMLERFNLSDSSAIPSAANLTALKADLNSLDLMAKARSRHTDKALRELAIKMDARRAEDKQQAQLELEQQEKTRKAAEEAERREKAKLKKKEKLEQGDNKRPPVTGAHAATGQGPSNDSVAKNEAKQRKRKQESPEEKRKSISPEVARLSDAEHQPVPAAPFVVFEPLEDDPTVYEIPESTEGWAVEEKKKAFSVARYPEDDLADLIPGDPPDEDYSKAKPSNQVNMNTFSSYIEPYFRPFSEEDLAFLRERGNKVTPYLIPELGRHYSELWAEEDGTNFASPAPQTNGTTNRAPSGPKGKPEDVSEDALEKDEVAMGPLLSRVMAAFLPEPSEPGDDEEQQVNGDSTPKANVATSMPDGINWKISVPKADYASLDDRVRDEMVHLGIMHRDEVLNFNAKEDDEVCARLRDLQHRLKEQSRINGARKARIAERLKEQLAYQEYVTILEDLDKQVEQAYSKRSRNMKATKKKKPVANGVGVAQARVGIGEQARTLMERRRRWNETIGPVFDKDLTRLPEGSIFDNLSELIEREKVGTVDDE